MAFAVIGFDSFSREWFPIGEYKTKKQAMEKAKDVGGTMTLAYVYDKNGEMIAKYGTY